MKPHLRISYLGPAGTYSEEAARAYCGPDAELIPAATTDEALSWAEQQKTDGALLPIENSTEGPVNRTLDLLQATPLHISGEITLPIHHQLLSRAASPAEIAIVLAHPQALAQCRIWLDRHLPRADRHAARSNGEAAKLAAQNPMLAAIASASAATAYDLPVLAKNIEDEANNTTRFVLVSPHLAPATGNDCTSLICAAPERPGGLIEMLSAFAQRGINLSKLQSRPVRGRLWRYVFYVDIDGHQDDPAVAQALSALHAQKMLIKVLGSYAKAKGQT